MSSNDELSSDTSSSCDVESLQLAVEGEGSLNSIVQRYRVGSWKKRGGEWYPENSGSRKFLFQSRNLGGILNESRNLVFLCFFASRILEFLAARSRSLGFLFFLANGLDQNHDKIVYLIKTYDSSLLNM